MRISDHTQFLEPTLSLSVVMVGSQFNPEELRNHLEEFETT